MIKGRVVENPLKDDLDHVLTCTQGLWEELRGRRLFITGGTGFFGCWLLESFAWANEKLGLNASALVLTRNPEAFRRKAPHLGDHRAIGFHAGDVRTFEFPPGRFSHVIHAATASSTPPSPLETFDTIVSGTRRVLDFAVACGAGKLLLTSSGAVYGRQPPEVAHVDETYAGAPNPDDPASAYGEGKRAAELLCTLYGAQHGFEAKIARCFAFVGPHLPLDAHFAVGNFIRDGLRGGAIEVGGDGTPYRSYLYAGDLMVWLWTILMRGRAGCPYNVGSESEVTIRELAATVAREFDPAPEVRIGKRAVPGRAAERYVPATIRAREHLGLQPQIDLRAAIQKTVIWQQQQSRLNH